MGIFKTKGIVIAEHNMSDYDKMVTILTPNGKIGCAAKGARRPKSSLMAGTQLLCFGDYLIYQGASSYSINSCDLIEVFYNLRIDLDKLTYASHILKIINDVTDENQNTYKILQLVLNTIYVISETDKNLDLTVSIFKMRLMCLLGLTPIINKCSNCGREDNLTHFSMRDSGFKCENCAKQDKGAIQIGEATVNAIKYTIMAPPKKLFSFNLSEESLKEFEIVSKLYLNEKLDKDYKIDNNFKHF